MNFFRRATSGEVKGGGLPYPFLKIESNCPDLAKKCPDLGKSPVCVHLWVRFKMQF